jgi:serine/threonine protein kinase
MLAGRRPFGGTSAVETVAKILEATPTSLSSLRADVPATLVALVSDCLEKDRNRRPSASDVHARLVSIRRSRDESTTSVGAVLRRRTVAVPLLVLMVAITGAGWWWWESGASCARPIKMPEVLALADVTTATRSIRRRRLCCEHA